MSETKFGGKTVGHSENHCVRKFRKVCVAMCNSNFFFFEKQKKIKPLIIIIIK